jgi:hypothetical protein
MWNRRLCNKKAVRFKAEEIVGKFRNEIDTWLMG